MISRNYLSDIGESISSEVNRLAKANLLWEQDFQSDAWFRRTPEFYGRRTAAAAILAADQPKATIALSAALALLPLPEQRDGLPMYKTCTDQVYVIIASVDQGVFPTHRNYEEAIAAWATNFIKYLSETPGDLLWWREHPEIEGHIPFGDTAPVWQVYSRLVIEPP